MINLLSLEPTKVCTDIKGKTFLFYGAPKIGKTSLSAQFPSPLLLAFEKGYEALDNVYAQPIKSWSEFRTVCSQLKKKEVKEKFSTIIVDTAQIAYSLATEYVASCNGVTDIGDIGFGKGYNAVEKEFEKKFHDIVNLGYGVVFIAHESLDKEEKGSGKEKVTKIFIRPDLEKRCFKVINKMVGLVGYLRQDEDSSKRWIYTRGTSLYVAGSRFPYLDEKIDLSYSALSDAIRKAIEKQKELDGATLTEEKEVTTEEPKMSFEEVSDKARKLWVTLITKNADNQKVLHEKIVEVFGRPLKLSELVPTQLEPYTLMLEEMEEIAKDQGIAIE